MPYSQIFICTKAVRNCMITRNGICYDFSLSEYRTTVNNLTFVFSSQLHLDKFKQRLKENRETINRSLTKRFDYCVDVTALADIVLYKKIETRGFLIVTNEGKELWQKSNIRYGGGKATELISNVQ